MRGMGWLFGVALFVALTAPATAQDQAAQIKQDVAALLEPLAGTGVAGEEAVLTHGAVAVAAAGPAYVVTIADLRWALDATGDFEIGTVNFTLTPEGDDLYRVADVRIPAEIPHRTPGGDVDGSISLPWQRFAAVWSRSLESFMQLDAGLRDVKIVSTADDMTLSLGAIGVTIASADKGNGRWDQDGTLHLAALNIGFADGVFALGSADGAYGTRDYDAKGWAALRARVETMAEKADTPLSMSDPQFAGPLRNAIRLFASWNLSLHVNALSFRDAAGREMFRLPTAALTGGAESFDQTSGRIALSLHHAGLVVNDIAPIVQDLLPRELAVNIAVENLPVQRLWRGAIDTLSSASVSTDEGSIVAMMTFMELLQQSLINGKARIDVTDSHVAMALARARLSGAIEASAGSMFGAIGRMTVDVTGLDPLIDAVMVHGGSGGEEIAGLQVARGFSTRQTAADGAVVDHYDIDVTPQGQFLVNGKEFSFMGPGVGGMPPAGSIAPDDSASSSN